MAKVKPLRIFGEVPADYAGPLYYRVVEDKDASGTKPIMDSRVDERWSIVGDDRNRHRHVLTSGLIVDSDGELLPEWRTPLKLKLLTDKDLSYEFYPGSWMTERVHDAIESLEPGRHIFIPVDATRPDGRIERQYAMLWGEAFLKNTPPPLHPELNDMELVVYQSGAQGFEKPDWAWSSTDPKFHFGYLNADVIGDRHFFATNLLDNQAVLSEALINKLREFGDVFSKFHLLCPIGAV